VAQVGCSAAAATARQAAQEQAALEQVAQAALEILLPAAVAVWGSPLLDVVEIQRDCRSAFPVQPDECVAPAPARS
jgi:hypothetical protein